MLRLGFTASLFSFFCLLVACSSSTSDGSQPTGGNGATEPAPSPTGGGKDAGAPAIPVKGATCNASKKCSGAATCVTGGGDEGFCALACDPKVGCAGGLRCAEVASAGAAFCLETCGDDSDCADGFMCTRSVGAVLGKYACVRSCKDAADYCGEGSTCGDDGVCPPRLVCDDAKTNSTGVAADRTLGSLTTAERGSLCDFTACGWGSYGASKKCDGGFSVSAPDSKSECTTDKSWTQCSGVTVGEYEACEKKTRADQCKALEILMTDPDCASLKACAM
jgi:hypothetical protein